MECLYCANSIYIIYSVELQNGYKCVFIGIVSCNFAFENNRNFKFTSLFSFLFSIRIRIIWERWNFYSNRRHSSKIREKHEKRLCAISHSRLSLVV